MTVVNNMKARNLARLSLPNSSPLRRIVVESISGRTIGRTMIFTAAAVGIVVANNRPLHVTTGLPVVTVQFGQGSLTSLIPQGRTAP